MQNIPKNARDLGSLVLNRVHRYSLAFWSLLNTWSRSSVPHYTRWGLYPQALILISFYAWWSFSTLLPGEAIAFLAFVAVFMTVRADKFTIAERVTWVILGFIILRAELSVLYLDRSAHDAQQASDAREQQQRFENTLSSFHSLLTKSDEATTRVNTVLKETQGVAKISRENLENLTGGSAFAYVVPSTTLPPAPYEYKQVSGFNMMVVNFGQPILSSVSVSIAHVIDEARGLTDGGLAHSIQVGSLPGHALTTVPDYYLHPFQDDPSGHPHYQLMIGAQNGTVHEDLWLRPAAKIGWAYKVKVIKGGHSKALLELDWTEPLPYGEAMKLPR
jgi:hypothetical protein